MQLLAANCILITAIGEGINRCNRFLPDFLSSKFIGMRNNLSGVKVFEGDPAHMSLPTGIYIEIRAGKSLEIAIK